MTKPDLLASISETLVEEPIGFSLTIAPRNRWHKFLQNNKYTAKYFPKKKHYEVYPITTGNLHRISALWNRMEIGDLNNEKIQKIVLPLMEKHSETMARIVAIAITNTKSGPPKSLVKEILWNTTTAEMCHLLLLVNQQMGTQNFLATTVLLKGMSLLQEEVSASNPSKTGPLVPGSF